MDEFQEADILWPDTAPSRQEEALLVPPEVHELAAASMSSRSEGFLSSAPSTAGASPGAAAADEELQEADVLWPDTVRLADEPLGGAGGFRWFRVDLARGAGRHAKPTAAAGRREGWRPALSSPIDIPARVAARCR